MAVLSLLCFVVGGVVGWGASKGGPTIRRAWPVILRIQILLTSAILSLAAAWRLSSVGQIVAPLVLAGGLWFMFGVTVWTRGNRSAGEGSLEAWAVSPNAGFWVVPTATAFAGPAGAMISVLANVANSAVGAVWIHLMRRDAPIPQRSATSWVDQSPLIASAAGLLLHLVGSAPASTKEILTFAGPLLAFSGAALFAGSAIHPHNLAVVRTPHALRRWAWLTAVRVSYFLLIVVITTSTPLAIVAALSALSAPSFNPVQLSVLYGYRSAVINAAVRWGWVLAPFGLGLAALLR
jgi:hypothetical protein